MQPTFVITRDGDVDLYMTPADAAANLEAVDVLDGEYEDAFSLEGERMNIVTDGDAVTLAASGTFELTRLRERLRALAERNGYTGEDPDPRQVANEILANQWRTRWPQWPHWLDRQLHGDGPPQV